MQRADSVETMREVLLDNRAELTEVERTVVMERFAIGNAGKPHTLGEVGEMIGLTNERVRQIQNHALTKLKAALVENGVAA
jgi:RNA polymerase nonessential primary-like sigma factor